MPSINQTTWDTYKNTLKIHMDLDNPIETRGKLNAQETQQRIQLFQQCFFNTQMASLPSINEYCVRASSSLFTTMMLVEDLTRFNSNNPKVTAALKSLHNMRRALVTEFAYTNELMLLVQANRQVEIEAKKHELKTGLIQETKVKIVKKVKELKAGESLTIPIGTARHYVLMEISCSEVDGQKKYLFRVYNSQYNKLHGAFSILDYINPWSKIPTLQISGVSEGICESDFFSKIYDAAYFSRYNTYSLFSEYLVEQFGGRILPPDPSRGHHPQGMYAASCIAKAGNFWLKETLGKELYSEFKTARLEFGVERLRKLKLQKEQTWAERNLSLFVCRVLYFLFNYMTLNATISLGEQMLRKRKDKLPRLSLLEPL